MSLEGRFDRLEVSESIQSRLAFALSYVPKTLYQLISASNELNPPILSKIQGTLLFVDISGFTKLSEILGTKGAEGIERMSFFVMVRYLILETYRTLNLFFGDIIGLIHSFGGDVIKIAGDALLVFWDADRKTARLAPYTKHIEWIQPVENFNTKEITSLLAIQCAHACIKAAKGSFEPITPQSVSDSSIPELQRMLSVHCAIASGFIYEGIFGGGDGSCEYILCGNEIFERMTSTLNESKKGELYIDSVTYNLLSNVLPMTGFIITTKVVETVSIYRVDKSILKDAISSSNLGNELGERRTSLMSRSTSNTDIQAFQLWTKQLRFTESQELFINKFIPRHIQKSSRDKIFNTVPEMRLCSVVFIGIGSFKFVDEKDTQTMQEIYTTIRNACDENDGFLRQFLIDDKGCVAIIVFGPPGYAHQDDAYRAVKTALEVHSTLQEKVHITANIGCSYGRVYCGDVGSSTRREAALVGATVNTAAHLMNNKKGILCQKSIYDETVEYFTYEVVDEVKMKGVDGYIKAFRPLHVGATEHSHATESTKLTDGNDDDEYYLTERGDERKTIDEFINSLKPIDLEAETRLYSSLYADSINSEQRGVTKLLSISGEFGVGRPSFLTYINRSLMREKIKYLTCKCNSIKSIDPFAVWGVLIQQILFQACGSDPVHQVELVQSIMRMESRTSSENQGPNRVTNLIENMLPLVNSILNLKFKSQQSHENMDPESKRQFQKTILSKIIHYFSATKICVIIFEETDSLDYASWELFRDFLANEPNIYGVISFDTIESSNTNSWIQRLRESSIIVQELLISPFNMESCKHIIAKLLVCNIAPEELVRMIHSKTSGNAYMIRELCRALVDANVVIVHERQVTVKNLSNSNVQLPGSLEGLVCQKVDNLTPDQSQILRICSVAGSTFSKECIESVLQNLVLPGIDVDGCFQAAISSSFIVTLPQMKDSYAFSSNVVKNIVYNTILSKKRENLHKIIGEYFEQRMGKGKKLPYHEIAFHFLNSKETKKAIKYYMLAGEDALNLHNLDEAIRCFNQADTLIKQENSADDTILDVICRFNIGECYKLRGDFPQSSKYLSECLEISNSRASTFKLSSFFFVFNALRRDHWLGLKRAVCSLSLPANRVHPEQQRERPTQVNEMVVVGRVTSQCALIPSNRSKSEAGSIQRNLVHLEDDESSEMKKLICARSYEALADIYFRQSRIKDALVCAYSGMELCEELKLLGTVARLSALLALIHSTFKNEQISSIHRDRVSAVLMQIEESGKVLLYSDAAKALQKITYIHTYKYEFSKGLKICNAALAYAQAASDFHTHFQLMMMQGYNLFYVLDLGAVRQFILDLHRYSLKFGDKKQHMITACQIATLYLRFGIGEQDNVLEMLKLYISEKMLSQTDTSYDLNTIICLGCFSSLIGHPYFARLAIDSLQQTITYSSLSLLAYGSCIYSMLCHLSSTPQSRLRALSRVRVLSDRYSRDSVWYRILSSIEEDLKHPNENPERDVEMITTLMNKFENSSPSKGKDVTVWRLRGYLSVFSKNVGAASSNFVKAYNIAKSTGNAMEMTLASFLIRKYSPRYEELIANRDVIPDSDFFVTEELNALKSFLESQIYPL